MTAAPGPNLFLVLHHTVSGGVVHAGAAIAGNCISPIVHAALAMFGLTLLVATSPNVFLVVKLTGATYITYMGVQALRATRKKLVVKLYESGKSKSIYELCDAFRDGFIVGALNPYTGVFILTVTPQFLSAGKGDFLLELGVFVAIIGLTKIVWFVILR